MLTVQRLSGACQAGGQGHGVGKYCTVHCREPKTGQQKVQLSSKTKQFAHQGMIYLWLAYCSIHITYMAHSFFNKWTLFLFYFIYIKNMQVSPLHIYASFYKQGIRHWSYHWLNAYKADQLLKNNIILTDLYLQSVRCIQTASGCLVPGSSAGPSPCLMVTPWPRTGPAWSTHTGWTWRRGRWAPNKMI